MYRCEICGAKADIHHIVHKHEGGCDININYKYLCNYHHRGKYGPHNCIETDIKYKLEMQKKLFKLLPKDYYTAKELYGLLETTNSSLKKLVKNLKLYKEGYSKREIITNLMGGKLYSYNILEEIELERLYHNINIS
ncbi:MAG: HNH endonuclease [Clostridium sp.]|uniref:HNH endonuclease signature motif containing protein n=1 Tax=Clostridium sp. TaxID=1506 RepID=UPI0025C316DA|nr:HNH endonuclease [Clostridium sp.]MCF0148271.1 HNH endonuclease [Clostridium sp.]